METKLNHPHGAPQASANSLYCASLFKLQLLPGGRGALITRHLWKTTRDMHASINIHLHVPTTSQLGEAEGWRGGKGKAVSENKQAGTSERDK